MNTDLIIGVAIFLFCMAMFLLMVFVVASFVRDQMEARRMFDIQVNDRNRAVHIWMEEWRNAVSRAQKDNKTQEAQETAVPIEQLHKNLADALAREDYEAAAKYRDEINKIETNSNEKDK